MGLGATAISSRYLGWTQYGEMALYEFDLTRLKNLRVSCFTTSHGSAPVGLLMNLSITVLRHEEDFWIQ